MSMVEWGGAGGGGAHPLSASGRAQHSIGTAEEPGTAVGAVFLSFAGGPSEASVVLSPPPGGLGRDVLC